MMVKDLVLGMAWKNDWKSIKKSNKLKLFYCNFFSCYDGKKVYSTDKVFDSLSKLNEFIDFRWLLRILSGTSPFEHEKNVVVCDYVKKEFISKYERKRTWNPKSKFILNRYVVNNGGSIRRSCFRINKDGIN